ncbi:PorT family protein [uncultured Pontibacter sp.]|uniref:PorT family protein n=1 Tax=uncultured Pontibacter sp. TaxID=453356 RepID=UPI00261CB1BE|nr:PorT family protein [uncultured Pontibacter sp.]
MSSATNNKRGGLEDEFRRRMQDAEASPSADLWARIDHSLTVQENGQYKRGMLFYKQLAAACVTLLLVAGGFAAYYFSGPAAAPMAQVQQQNEAIAATPQAVTPHEASTNDKAIAEAMQEAVQPLKLEAAEQQEPIRASIARAAKSSKTVPEANSMANQVQLEVPVVASVTATSDPSAWHSLPAAKYGAATKNNQASREAMNVRSMFSRLESMHRAFTDRSVNSSGFVSAGTPAFAQTAPEVTDDFRKLNEIVMSRMKQLKAEQDAVQQMYRSEQNALASAGAIESDHKEAAAGRWSVGMAYAPSYFEQNIGMPTQRMGPVSSFASFAPPTAMQQSARMMDEATEEHKEEVEPGFSFGVEAKAGLKLGKKWKLLSGLGFTQNTARSKSSYVIQQFWRKPGAQKAETPGATTIFVPSLSSNYASDSLSVARTNEFDVTYRYRHLTVPVGVQYEGKMGKDWFWFAGGGVAANILLQTSILASSAEVRDIDYELGDENSPFRKLQWSGNVTAGVGKRLSNNVSVTVGPEYRAYFDTMLSSPEKAQAPQGKPYTMGINMALNYDLGSGRK